MSMMNYVSVIVLNLHLQNFEYYHLICSHANPHNDLLFQRLRWWSGGKGCASAHRSRLLNVVLWPKSMFWSHWECNSCKGEIYLQGTPSK